MSTTQRGNGGTSTRSPEPWTSGFDRDTAMRLAATEYERLADLLADLSSEEWHLTTECPAWDVHQMAAHCVGMAQLATGLREAARQLRYASRAARRSGRPQIDELTDLQVREHRHLEPATLPEAMRRTGRAAVAGRRRAPRPLRALTFTDDGVGTAEKWRVGYLLDTILTRDPWTHRGDICRTTGRQMHLTADHDGLIVADVVAEWAKRHGQPYDLTLTGPAGGHWREGEAGEPLELDAVEFCRTLSGRVPGSGLLATTVPF